MENQSYDGPLPAALFERMDNEDDSVFYQMPRFVLHVDEPTIAMLTQYLDETLPTEPRILDLMSSWVSHLPDDVSYRRVAGLGMNADELGRNPRLDDWSVHDLNADPTLPYPDQSFDAVVNAVSVQYLARPVEVFAEIARVLSPGGASIVAMSHRCFPTKAIRAFHVLTGPARQELVARYHANAGGFEAAEPLARSPVGADPLWIVRALRAGDR